MNIDVDWLAIDHDHEMKEIVTGKSRRESELIDKPLAQQEKVACHVQKEGDSIIAQFAHESDITQLANVFQESRVLWGF